VQHPASPAVARPSCQTLDAPKPPTTIGSFHGTSLTGRSRFSTHRKRRIAGHSRRRSNPNSLHSRRVGGGSNCDLGCVRLFYAKAISDKQLEKILDYHQKKEGVQGNVIWHYGNIAGNHALRRNEFWSSTIQIIGAIVVVAILSALLIYRVISAEAALPIISAVSGFGLSRASTLNPSDTTKSDK
jgi:hypothetical protein